MSDKLDYLRAFRNVMAGVATATLSASALAAWSAGPTTAPSVFTVWLIGVSLLTLIGGAFAIIVTIGYHHDYIEAKRSN